MSGIFNNIYIDKFLIAAFVKYILSQICSHVLLDTFWRLWKLLFFEENIFKIISHLFIFYPRTSNFHNSRMVGRGKLPDLSMSNIFSVLSIVFIYMTSFWPEVQSCYNNAKRSVLKTQG